MTDTPRYAYDSVPPASHGGHVALPKSTPPKGGYPPKAKYQPGNIALALSDWRNNSQSQQERHRAKNPNQVCKACKERPLGKRHAAYEAGMCTECYREQLFVTRQQALAKDHPPCVVCGGEVMITRKNTVERYMKQRTCGSKCASQLAGKITSQMRWGNSKNKEENK